MLEAKHSDVVDISINPSYMPDLIHMIGNTPLIEVHLPENPHVKVYAKAEWMNPGGSVKDRAAWYMLRDGITTGKLDYSKTVLEATSGNTGIALAMIGASLGLKVTICIPKNASKERISLLKSYGAKLILTDPLEGTDGAIIKAEEIYNHDPDKYFYPDQYNNDSNWLAHFEQTGPEILSQMETEITHFVSVLGTSGTFTGVGKRLKIEFPHIRLISVQPDSPFHGLEGMKHMESAIKPGIYHEELADENITVNTIEAYDMTKYLAQKNGLLVGISSGAVMVAINNLAAGLESGVIVTVFPDRGDRYLSDRFWEVSE